MRWRLRCPSSARLLFLLTPMLLLLSCVMPVGPNPYATQQSVEALRAEAANKGLSPEQMQLLSSLNPQGPAPELSNEIWINSKPLQLADLRGKVVIVEFWTYG